jgi:hypothetical protein
MKWKHNFNNLVGTSSLPKEVDDLKDNIIFAISSVVLQ